MQELAAWMDGTKGTLLAVLPETAYARTDPGKIGVVHQWYLPDAKFGGKLISTKLSWYDQGFVTPEGDRYSGLAWYRSRVTLPTEPAGNVALLLPYLKGQEAWVWVNGKYAGFATRGDVTAWGRTGLIVDAPGLFHKGENLVVLRINGNGGLILPPAVIARKE